MTSNLNMKCSVCQETLELYEFPLDNQGRPIDICRRCSYSPRHCTPVVAVFIKCAACSSIEPRENFPDFDVYQWCKQGGYQYTERGCLCKLCVDRYRYCVRCHSYLPNLVFSEKGQYCMDCKPTEEKTRYLYCGLPAGDKRGYVYVIDGANTGLYKIGRTNNVKKRLEQLSALVGTEALSVVHYITCADCTKVERDLHKFFADKRVDGEWFSLSETDISLLKSVSTLNQGQSVETIMFASKQSTQ